MRSLAEWCFELDVADATPIPRSTIDALLNDAIAWAEDRSLGIGGGYRPVTPEVADAASEWRFEFGLCIQADQLLIPEEQAAALQDALRGWCGSRKLLIAGGFRPFTPPKDSR